ncbi:hypothetical protein J1614_011068 [Plenodomus biglobosus]|nr:hypothetical protein J1614_011068 [Plenodomus biglobosus]
MQGQAKPSTRPNKRQRETINNGATPRSEKQRYYAQLLGRSQPPDNDGRAGQGQSSRDSRDARNYQSRFETESHGISLRRSIPPNDLLVMVIETDLIGDEDFPLELVTSRPPETDPISGTNHHLDDMLELAGTHHRAGRAETIQLLIHTM